MCSTAPPVVLGSATCWRPGSEGRLRLSLHGPASGDRPVVGRLRQPTPLPRAEGDRYLDLSPREPSGRAVVDMRARSWSGRALARAQDRRDQQLRDPDYGFEAPPELRTTLPRDDRCGSSSPATSAASRASRGWWTAVLSDDRRRDRVQLVLMGEGAAKDGLVRRSRRCSGASRGRVVLLPHGPAPGSRAHAGCRLGLVTLAPGVDPLRLPQQDRHYLSEGLPLFSRVETESRSPATSTEWGWAQVISTAVEDGDPGLAPSRGS